jgi:hypothetical protein
MTPEITDLAASVHQRLLNQSKALDLDFNLLLARYAIERFLYRLAQSPYADRFVLKGAMLLQIWLPEAGRPTRDLDLLGFGDVTPDRLRRILAAVCDQPVAADGCRFLADSVVVAAIRSQDEYGGQRVTLEGRLGNARLHVQVDVGAGETLAEAVHDTFERRRTAIPLGPATALTPAFGQNPDKARQWKAFLAKSRLVSVTEDFETVVRSNAGFLGPVLDAARAGAIFQMTWPPGGPWQPEQRG